MTENETILNRVPREHITSPMVDHRRRWPKGVCRWQRGGRSLWAPQRPVPARQVKNMLWRPSMANSCVQCSPLFLWGPQRISGLFRWTQYCRKVSKYYWIRGEPSYCELGIQGHTEIVFQDIHAGRVARNAGMNCERQQQGIVLQIHSSYIGGAPHGLTNWCGNW